MVNIINAFLHGLEKPLILWLLSRGPKHGYELMGEFRKLTGLKLKPARVYPFLQWLEDKGFATSEWVKRGGRNLRCYSLTKKGESLLLKARDLFDKPLKDVIMDLLSEQKGK
jgi:DNA-binding PadR family transcriptional regulator